MTSHSVTISVVVPVYNASAYLGACVDSILAQSFSDFELILVNDGSRDKSGRICDDYAEADSRIRVIHTENRGVSSARNRGLSAAVGEWVAFVDSDDAVGKDYLKSLYQGAEAVGFDKRSIVLCGFRMLCRTTEAVRGEVMWDSLVVPKERIPWAYLHYQIYRRGQPFSKLYNRATIEAGKLRFDPDIRFSEDLLFLLQYLKEVSQLVFSSSVDYNYYVAVGSGLSKSYSTYLAELKLYERFVLLSDSLLEGHEKDLALLRKEESFIVRAATCLYRGGGHFTASDRRAALKRLAHAIPVSYSPDSFGARLLKAGAIGLFDIIYSVTYGLRYSQAGNALWRGFCRVRWKMGK